MSLKFMHQVIIFAGIGIALIFAWWCFMDDSTAGSVGFKVAGGLSVGAAIGLGLYEIYFLRKTRRLIIQ